MALKLLETKEQKENKAGNTGTKAAFREQGIPKSKKMLSGNKGTLLGTREHREIVFGNKGTWTPRRPSFDSADYKKNWKA